MSTPRPRPRSLRGRLLITLLPPLFGLALGIGVGGAWLIHRTVEGSGDRLLSGSLRAISETLDVEDGQLTLDLPPAALEMLENADHDNVYYSVRLQGQLVTGYPELPALDTHLLLSPNEVAFQYAVFRGVPIRVATQARLVPRMPAPVIVQVAETLRDRRQLEARMLMGLAAAELTLLTAVALLVWVAVGWGLKPLSTLRDEVAKRTARGDIDFRPLPVHDVPREARTLVEAFNSLFAQLDTAVNALRRFTADASHQMRTPLAVLRTHVDLFNRYEAKTPAARSMLEDIDSAVRNLQRLLMQLICMARIEEQPEDPAHGASFDLVEIAKKAAGEHVERALHAGLTLSFETSWEGPMLVRGDPFLAAEILYNLIDNAIRYNAPGGSVWLRLGAAQCARLDIEDDGPGIPYHERERVFERFYRIGRDNDREGSGLGLAIVRAIAARMGARVTLGDAGAIAGLRATVEFEFAGK